jgi:hypothetical protein
VSANDEDGVPDPEVDNTDVIFGWAKQASELQVTEMKARVDLQIGRMRAELERAEAREVRSRWYATAKRAKARFGWLSQQLAAMIPVKRRERHEAEERERARARQASFQAAAKDVLPPDLYEAVLAEYVRRQTRES